MTMTPIESAEPLVSDEVTPVSILRALRSPLPTLGLVIIVLWFVVAAFASLIAPYGPNKPVGPPLQAPSGQFVLGTDALGRDVLSRVIFGGRISLPAALIVAVAAMLIGVILGGLAALGGRAADTVIMRIADLVFAFPTIILAMVISAALGAGVVQAGVALIAVSWPTFARVTRGLVHSIKNSDFVSVSRMLGYGPWTVLRRDIVPNISGPIVVLTMISVAQNIILLAALSFLGLGAQPPAPEWGAMVSLGATQFNHWWLSTMPALAILTSVLAFNLLGDGLREAFDPLSGVRNA